MAKSPKNHDSSALADKYLLGWKATYRLLKEGRSWSGSERNCAFLNCGDGRYANVSAVTGLDFSDDARGLAVTDWDHDGDLDLWLSNRTGPRLRLMRNRTDTPGRFVAFKLCGSSSNRDAIGARVEVVLSEAKSNIRAEKPKGEIATQNPVPASRILPLSNGHGSLIQTVYAGDGFVSQSTKWLHFGLPANAHIKEVTVRWPGGQTQKLTSIQAGRRYVVVENQSKPTEWHPPSREIRLVGAVQSSPQRSDVTRVVLPIRLPLPVLRYARFDLRLPHVTSENAQDLRALRTSQKPLLVNFWASWCEPCLSELQDVTTRADDIRTAGLDILALTVDGLNEGKATGRTDARKMVESLAYPFEVGLATPEMLDKLELIQRFLFHRLPRSSIPASYLLDRHGRLAVLYRGPVNVDEVLNDVANLGASPEELRDLSVPFSGRWNGRVPGVALRFLAKEFEGQYVEDYVTYLEKAIQQQELNRSQVQEKKRRRELDEMLAQLHLSLAEAHLRQDNVADAIAHYRQIVELLPESPQARVNLGNALMADGKLEEAMDLFRHVLNQDSTFTDAHFNLAQALRSVGKLEEAAFHFEEVLRHNPADPHAHLNLGSWLISQHKIEEAIDHYRQALKHDPEYIEAHYELARALKFQGHVSAAIMEYREVLRRTLNHGRAHFDLGMLLYRQGNVGLSIDHLQETIRLIPDWPKALNAASWIWATCPDAAVRQPTAAVRLAQKAATLTGRRDPLILDTLAAAYAADGQFEMAISTAQAALELALSNQAQTLADKIRKRLELYRQEQPYIESV